MNATEMKNSVFPLFQRGMRKLINIRTMLIWMAMAGMGIFFFYATGGKSALVKDDQLSFIALFLPHMIFGSWAVLSSYFDLISSEREHNVLDCILCSGISKSRIFMTNVLVTMVMSLILAGIYMLPVTCLIIVVSKNVAYIAVLLQYLFPLWGYIMVYAAIGVLISVIARSSKAALIWSLAIGLVMMPRFFVMIIEGLGKIFGWTDGMVERISRIAPGVMMQAMSEISDRSGFLSAIVTFGVSILMLYVVAYFIFTKQDEYNYGE